MIVLRRVHSLSLSRMHARASSASGKFIQRGEGIIVRQMWVTALFTRGMLHRQSYNFLLLYLLGNAAQENSAIIAFQRKMCTQTLLPQENILSNISSPECGVFNFPENITITEIQCGVLYSVNIFWNGISDVHGNTTIAWCGDEDEGVVYDISHVPHLVEFHHLERIIDIAVTFSNIGCSKTTLTHYIVERVLTSVSLKAQKLVIESRKCVSNPKRYEYRIVATLLSNSSALDLGNISFSSTLEYDVGDLLLPNKLYLVNVKLAEEHSDIAIDEMNTTIQLDTSLNNGDATCQTDPVIIGVGVAGGFLGGVLIGIVATVFLMVSFSRKKRTRVETVAGTGYSCVGDVSMAVRALYQLKTSSVVYDTVTGNNSTTDIESSQNVAYRSPQTVPNPAYGELSLTD